jgi:hypothetical protein
VTSQTHTYGVTAITQTDRTVRYTLTLGGAPSHGLFTGQVVTISGSSSALYNGAKIITVVSGDTIEFQIPLVGSPDLSTSALQVTFVGIQALITSVEYSESSNLTVGETLSLLTPIDGITEVARVQISGVLGGGSEETDDQLYGRVLARFQKPFTRLNRNDVYDLLKTVDPKLSYFEVRQGYPTPGQAIVYVGKVGATVASSQYTLPELAAFASYLNQFTDIGVQVDGIEVRNLIPTILDVTVTGISPNSATMIAALQTTIEGYFEDLTIGKDISLDELRGLVATTVAVTGEIPLTYTLTAPTMSTTIPAYGRAYLGNVTLSTV